MKEFIEYLLEIGYKPYRKILENEEWSYVPETKALNTHYIRSEFNTQKRGGTDIRFVKDDDFDNEIIIGLNEVGKPPLIIYPRPMTMKVKEYTDRDYKYSKSISLTRDKYINEYVNSTLPKEVYEFIRSEALFIIES